jgi:hypothetical protein
VKGTPPPPRETPPSQVQGTPPPPRETPSSKADESPAVTEEPVDTDSKQVPEAALAEKTESHDESGSDEHTDGIVGSKRRGIRLKQDLS